MSWPVLLPALSAGVLGVALVQYPALGWVLMTACATALVAAVVSSVHHAELIAQRLGEPFGTLVLALAITVIEVALVLVTPSLTTSSPGATYTNSQLVFVALSSLSLWLVFVFIQTIRHRDYFLPEVAAADESVHAEPPSRAQAWASFGLLVVSLVTVVGLAKLMSPSLERLVIHLDAPKSAVGIVIAMIVLMPETWAAMRAARANRLQTSMNLAIGSALASIGLTIPIVVVAAVLLDLPLELGLVPKDMALLALTFIVGSITLASGRTNLMQGAVHLVLFAAFLFLTLVP